MKSENIRPSGLLDFSVSPDDKQVLWEEELRKKEEEKWIDRSFELCDKSETKKPYDFHNVILIYGSSRKL
uniref:Uncharacterized protein n=1 Tax=Caenorhabditis tropicalis TaxID=1561998 RepID=A0A1I7T4H5_9PELO